MNGYTADEKERVAEENMKLVYYMVNKFRNTKIEKEELTSAALTGFAKALNSFDKDAGFAISTFVCNAMRFEILKLIRHRKLREHVRKTKSLDFDMENQKYSDRQYYDLFEIEEDGYVSVEIREVIEKVSERLTKGEKKVLELMLAGKDKTEIRHEMGTSRQYISRYALNISEKFKREWEKNK